MNTSVLLIAFRKPDKTQIVLDRIKQSKPKKLYVACDAPRIDVEGEADNCEKTRDLVRNLRWDCEIKTLFKDKNLGAKKAFESAIDWFFSNEDEGIVIEDDGLASFSFFQFAEEMLEKYRNDARVMHITAVNFIDHKTADGASYYFARIQHAFAFATWKRAWALRDMNMLDFDTFVKTDAIKNIIHEPFIQKQLLCLLDIYGHNNHNWDVCWAYTILKNNGLCIVPAKNLVENIDMPPTHVAYTKAEEIEFPLIHPAFMLFDEVVIKRIFIEVFGFKKNAKTYSYCSTRSRTNMPTLSLKKIIKKLSNILRG